jgi:hypothetical protein
MIKTIEKALWSFYPETPNWYDWAKVDKNGIHIPNSERMQTEHVIINPAHEGIVTRPTDLEINAKITELENAEPLRVLREERNRKLAQTDWRASSDLTLSSDWATYRQALRNLPSTATPTLDDDGNLENVTWPDEPT